MKKSKGFKNFEEAETFMALIEEEAEAARMEGEELVRSMDWNRVGTEIARQVRLAAPRPRPKLPALFSGWRVLAPAMTSVFVLGMVLGYLLFHSPSPPVDFGGGIVSREVSRDGNMTLERMESSLARREVIGYLKQTQLFLTDLMREKEGTPTFSFPGTHNIARARTLLNKNRYFSRDLTRTDLASARGLLEKIQWLLIEMVAQEEDDTISDRQLRRFRLFVEKERLLLKIRLIEEELSTPYDEV